MQQLGGHVVLTNRPNDLSPQHQAAYDAGFTLRYCLACLDKLQAHDIPTAALLNNNDTGDLNARPDFIKALDSNPLMVAMLAPAQFLVHISTLVYGQKAVEGHSYSTLNPNPIKLAEMLPRWPEDTGFLHVYTATVSHEAALRYAMQHHYLDVRILRAAFEWFCQHNRLYWYSFQINHQLFHELEQLQLNIEQAQATASSRYLQQMRYSAFEQYMGSANINVPAQSVAAASTIPVGAQLQPLGMGGSGERVIPWEQSLYQDTRIIIPDITRTEAPTANALRELTNQATNMAPEVGLQRGANVVQAMAKLNAETLQKSPWPSYQLQHGRIIIPDLLAKKPDIFPLICPHLFPYGGPSISDSRVKQWRSLEQWGAHMLTRSSKHYARDMHFVTALFGLIMRKHAVGVTFAANRRAESAGGEHMRETLKRAQDVINETAKGRSIETNKWRSIMRQLVGQLSVYSAGLPGTPPGMLRARTEALSQMSNVPGEAVFFTNSFSDTHSLNVQRVIDPDKPDAFYRALTPQQKLMNVIANPVDVAIAYDIHNECMKRHIYFGGSKVFGTISAHIATDDEQERGTLHMHGLGILDRAEVPIYDVKRPIDMDRLRLWVRDRITALTPPDTAEPAGLPDCADPSPSAFMWPHSVDATTDHAVMQHQLHALQGSVQQHGPCRAGIGGCLREDGSGCKADYPKLLATEPYLTDTAMHRSQYLAHAYTSASNQIN